MSCLFAFPTDHLILNFGRRVLRAEGGDRWNTGQVDLITQLIGELEGQAVPFLSCIRSLGDFVEVAKTFSQSNPNTQRAIAYSLARAGRTAEALKTFAEMLDRLDSTISWQSNLAVEATRMRELRLPPVVSNNSEAEAMMK